MDNAEEPLVMLRDLIQKENSAAIDIQRTIYHGTRGRRKAAKRAAEVAVLNSAANSIQRRRRGIIGRRIARTRAARSAAATVIQTAWRRYSAILLRLRLIEQRAAAIKIQRQARRRRIFQKAAKQIQRCWRRGWMGRRRARMVRRIRDAATTIASAYRAYKTRLWVADLRRLKLGAVSMQRVWRGYRGGKRRASGKMRVVGATEIQRIWRGHRTRRSVKSLRKRSAELIQRMVRGHAARQSVARHMTRIVSPETSVRRRMRKAALEVSCTWLSSRSMPDHDYLCEAFSSETVVSETSHVAAEEGRKIGALLYKNRQVKTLILSNGALGDDGCACIANSLQFNTRLHSLVLGPNDIGAGGAERIATVLKNHNFSLRCLEIDGNPKIGRDAEGENEGEEGATALAEAIGDFFFRNYGRLECFALSSCGISDAAAELFGNALFMNRKLLTLDLSRNKISNRGALFIADGLLHNGILWKLDLRENGIGSVGAIALVDAATESRALRWLSLDSNVILEDAANALLGTFSNSNFQFLGIKGNPLPTTLLEEIDGHNKARRKGPRSSDVPLSLPPLRIGTPLRRRRSFKRCPEHPRRPAAELHGSNVARGRAS